MYSFTHQIFTELLPHFIPTLNRTNSEDVRKRPGSQLHATTVLEGRQLLIIHTNKCEIIAMKKHSLCEREERKLKAKVKQRPCLQAYMACPRTERLK